MPHEHKSGWGKVTFKKQFCFNLFKNSYHTCFNPLILFNFLFFACEKVSATCFSPTTVEIPARSQNALRFPRVLSIVAGSKQILFYPTAFTILSLYVIAFLTGEVSIDLDRVQEPPVL